MKDPYKILGLSRGASAEEVKKAYRRLAKEIHPDVNPNASDEKFHEIAFAYEFLTNPSYRSKKEVAGKTKEDEKKQRYETAKRRYKEQRYREYVAEQRFYEKEISGVKRKYFNVILVLCCVINFLLVLDVLLPGDWNNQKRVEIKRGADFGGFSHIRLQLVRTDESKLYISSEQVRKLRGNGFLSVENSKIFRFAKRVGVKGRSEYHILSPGFSYMSSFPVLNFLLLIPLAARWLMKKRNLTFILFYRLSLFGMPVLFLAMLIFYL